MSEPKRIGITRVVPGDRWMLGKNWQEREWDIVRGSFDNYLTDHGLSLIGEATETTEYDEKRGEVILRRRGRAR